MEYKENFFARSKLGLISPLRVILMFSSLGPLEETIEDVAFNLKEEQIEGQWHAKNS
jgi:hypothetical protein